MINDVVIDANNYGTFTKENNREDTLLSFEILCRDAFIDTIF